MERIWEVGRAALLPLSFWGYFFLVYRFGRVRIWFVPLTCMAGISLALFFGGLLDALPAASALIFWGGLAGFAVFAVFGIRGKAGRLRLSLCGVCFFAGTAAFALLSLTLKLVHYDNFSHWALIVKYLLSAERFPGADTALIPFRDYPPGASLFIYYVCRFAGHAQGVMLLAQNSLIFACFYAVFGIVKEQRRFLLYSFLGMGCALLSYLNLTIRINSLLVDFLLPLLAMASAAVSYRCAKEKGRLCVLQIILLGFTGIVKTTGVFFAAAAGVYALVRMLWPVKNDIRSRAKRFAAGKPGRVLYGVVMICGAAIFPLLWQYHLHTDLAGFEGKFELGKTAGEYGAPVEEALYGQVRESFFEAALDPSGRAVRVLFLCTVLAAAAVLYARVRLKKRWYLGLVLPAVMAVTALYYAGMLYMYLHSMPAEEALRMAGFERYACSAAALFAGVLLMAGTVDLEHSFAVDIDERGPYRAYSSPGAKRRYQYAVLASMLLGVNFLYSEFNGLLSIRADFESSLPARVQRTVGDHWYTNGQTDEKRYLIVAPDEGEQVVSGEVRYVCRYFLWAADVEVTESLSESEWEEAQKEYDRIIVLDVTVHSYV